MNSIYDNMLEEQGRHLQTMRKWHFPQPGHSWSDSCCGQKNREKAKGRGAITIWILQGSTLPQARRSPHRNPRSRIEDAQSLGLIVQLYCPCFVKFTFRNRKIRMPKTCNLQLVHLCPNSNLPGLELKYTHTHTYRCYMHVYLPHTCCIYVCVRTWPCIYVEEGKMRSSDT